MFASGKSENGQPSSRFGQLFLPPSSCFSPPPSSPRMAPQCPPRPEPHLPLPSVPSLASLTYADLLLQPLANLVDGLEVSCVEVVLCHGL